MGILEVKRQYDCGEGGGFGVMRVIVGGKDVYKCRSLERSWHNNKRHISCIPKGTYLLHKRINGRFYDIYKKRWGHKHVFQINGVKNRDGILIHAAGNSGQLQGCIAPCKYPVVGKVGLAWISGKQSERKEMEVVFGSGRSRDAYVELYKVLNKHGIDKVRIC